MKALIATLFYLLLHTMQNSFNPFQGVRSFLLNFNLFFIFLYSKNRLRRQLRKQNQSCKQEVQAQKL
jgi:hypothetical protein